MCDDSTQVVAGPYEVLKKCVVQRAQKISAHRMSFTMAQYSVFGWYVSAPKRI